MREGGAPGWPSGLSARLLVSVQVGISGFSETASERKGQKPASREQGVQRIVSPPLLDFWELSIRHFLSTNFLFYKEDTEAQRGDVQLPLVRRGLWLLYF